MACNDNKSYLGYLNKLVDEYNNTYHHSIGKKLFHADYSALTEEIKSSHKAPKFKVGDRVRIYMYKKLFQQSLHPKLFKKIFVILKTNPWTYKIKDLNGKTIIGSFYEKELLLSKL